MRSFQDMAKGRPFAISFCFTLNDISKAYSFDPLANLSESQQHLVLGGKRDSMPQN